MEKIDTLGSKQFKEEKRNNVRELKQQLEEKVKNK